jgi:hypothetical protein
VKITTEEFLLRLFGCTICACLLIYFIGMFALKQQTNTLNLPLRAKLVDLLSFMAAQILAIVYVKVTGKEK